MSEHQAQQNTDKPLFTDEAGNSCHLTERGGLGINVGGSVAVLPLAQWFACMREAFPKPEPKPQADQDRRAMEREMLGKIIVPPAVDNDTH